MGFKPHTAFPVLLLQPLGHLSKCSRIIIAACDQYQRWDRLEGAFSISRRQAVLFRVKGPIKTASWRVSTAFNASADTLPPSPAPPPAGRRRASAGWDLCAMKTSGQSAPRSAPAAPCAVSTARSATAARLSFANPFAIQPKMAAAVQFSTRRRIRRPTVRSHRGI